ncbi:MAG TPA: isochorismatase family protein [Roseiflexaceae bacterium]|nr:isochorismatase family protein [Roseiflexaceae bacterium]
MTANSLLAAEDSVLIVIDVQPAFLHKLEPEEHPPLLQRICWLIGVANWLNIPLVVTAEDIPRDGTIDDQVARRLPPDTPIYNKMVFGLAADPAIRAAVERTHRKTAILVGLETDVCVAHSALGLLGAGYQVAVVADATGAPGSAHELGLARVRDAGAAIVGVKGLFYEWIRTVEQARRFRHECRHLGRPDGITL